MIRENSETHMRWRKIGFWSLLVVVGILVLAASWVWTADLGVFKPQIERWVSEKTGRTLSIGDLSIDIAGRIIVVGRDISFANADGATPEHMVSIGRAEVEVDLASLFGPTVIVEAIEIADADIHLAVSADGSPNWQLDLPDAAAPAIDEENDAGLPLLLRDARIFNLTLVYDSADRPLPLELAVASATQRLREDEFLDLKIRGTLSGRDVAVEGELGTWESLLAAEHIEYSLSGRFDTLTLASSGYIDDLSRPTQPTMSFEAAGPDIDHLTEMLGLGDEGSGDISIAGGLSANVTPGMRLDVTGNLGETSIEARADFTSLADLTRIDAELRSSGPDLGQVLALAGVPGLPRSPFQLIADLERDGPEFRIAKAEMLYGDAQFLLTADLPRFPSLDDGNAELSLKGRDIDRFRRVTGLPGAASGPFSLQAGLSVDGDQRERFEVDLETSLGRVTANGEVRGGDTYLGTTADIDLEVFDVSTTAAAWKLDIGDVPADALTVNAGIEYVDSGIRTLRPLTASLGDASLSVEGLVALAEDLAGTDLLFEAAADRLTDLTAPFADSEYVPSLPLNLEGHLLVNPGEYRITDLSGSLGGASIAANASIRPVAGVVDSTVEFSAQGDALEELVTHVGDLKFKPGAFGLSGRLVSKAESIELSDFYLERPMGELRANVSIGLPASREFLSFDVHGNNADVRNAFSSFGAFEAAPAPFSLVLVGQRDGDSLRIDDLEIGLGEATLTASGNLEMGERIERTGFSFDVAVPDMSALGTLDGRNFSAQALALAATIEGAPGEIRIDDLVTTMDGSHLSGSVLYRVGETRYLNVDLQSDRLVFAPLLEPLESDELEYDPEPERKDGRLIPDVPIPFDALASLDADFKLDIAEFERGELYLYDVHAAAGLSDGVLAVDDVTFRSRSGYLRARARLDPADGQGKAKLEMIMRDFALGMSATNRELQMKGDAAINLDASGNDLRALAGSANGIVFLVTTGGEIGRLPFLQVLYGDMLDEILTTVNPFAKSDPVTRFDCIVFPIQIADGVTSSDPASFIRTDKINITLKSRLDFKTEKLTMNIRSTPRKILTISAAELINPYIKVVGTLAKPALAVDERGVLISGGAAAATGGLSLLARAAWDRLARSQKPCKAVFDEGIKALSPQFPDIPELEQMPDRPATVAQAN